MRKTDIDRRSEEISLGLGIEKTNLILKELLKEKLGITEEDIAKLVKEKAGIRIPISVFHNKLSTLEVAVKYLKEELQLKNNEIAELLDRDQKTIWSTYERTAKKGIAIKVEKGQYDVPVKILANRELSILEALVKYLRENNDLSLVKIAELLMLDSRTVWTVYNRAKKKGGASK